MIDAIRDGRSCPLPCRMPIRPQVTFVIRMVGMNLQKWGLELGSGTVCFLMEVLTQKAVRRSTRLRVEIPVSVISLDRMRPFAEKCVLLVVSAQGCGFRSSCVVQPETPIMISDLPGGGSVTARVANCVPLGNDGKYFLIGAALYTHGNVWGIADAPEDWNVAAKNDPVASSTPKPAAPPAAEVNVKKKAWPYNVFAAGAELHPGRK